MAGNLPGGAASTTAQHSAPEDQANDAAADMLRNYFDMRAADTSEADKYFHCKANCEASTRGPGGHAAAAAISNLREAWGVIKGDGTEDRAADQVANRVGRVAASGPNFQGCEAACGRFRPSALSPKYHSSR